MTAKTKRAVLHEARAVHGALCALEALDHLDRHATPDALNRPRLFILELAKKHKLLKNVTDVAFVRHGRLFLDHRPSLADVPERLPPLTMVQLEGFQRIVLHPIQHRDPSGPWPWFPGHSKAFLQRVFAEHSPLEALRAAEYWQHWEGRRAGLLADWCFSEHPDREVLATAAYWTRYYLCFLAARAAEILAHHEATLLNWFLRDVDLSALGSAAPPELRDAQQLRDSQQLALMRWLPEAATPSDLVPVALSGHTDMVQYAVHEAGVAAFDWPWLRQVVEAWHWAATDELTEPKVREVARKNLEMLGKALAHIGKGPPRKLTPAERQQNKQKRLQVAKAAEGLEKKFAKALRGLDPKRVSRTDMFIRVITEFGETSKLGADVRSSAIKAFRDRVDDFKR